MTPDFTDNEIAVIHDMLTRHYQKDVEIHLSDSEILLKPGSTEPTVCRAVFWHAREANFVVVKTSCSSFRAQFFYTPHDQFDTAVDEFSSVNQCIAAVLKSHANHQSDDLDTDSANPAAGLH